MTWLVSLETRGCLESNGIFTFELPQNLNASQSLKDSVVSDPASNQVGVIGVTKH